MAIITNQANLTYTYGATTASVLSNLASTELAAPLSAEKRALDEGYRSGSELTYVISLRNESGTALSNVSVTDDLGAYVPDGGTDPVQPLTVSGAAMLYLDGVFSEALSPVVTEAGATFTIPSIPAGASALLIYQAAVNGFAPMTQGSEITNTAEIGTDPVTVSATVPVESFAHVTVEKEMTPDPVAPGGTLTATFTVENDGNEPATDLVLTDAFPIPLSNVSVTVNGAPVTDFTFEADTLTLPAPDSGATTLTVPAATFTQDPATGAVTVKPGTLTVVLTGTV
ncbi:MAG: DUF11 domain-containing protein [Clostridia bacterium]|nr:DUF11 domain-containing protein [Clostridia bacterium]